MTIDSGRCTAAPCWWRASPWAAAVLLAVAAALPALPALAVQDTAAPPAPADFTFHGEPWLCLHHVLYQWAREDARPVERPSALTAEREDVARLDEVERAAWQAAVEAYRRHGIARDLLHDAGMFRFASELTTAGAEAVGEPALAAALAQAMPIYRRQWWPAHEERSRAWVAAVEPLVERFGGAIAADLERAVGGTFPPRPVRVDVCPLANWAGAYTGGDPPRITVAADDPDLQGDAALEILYHEASHSAGLAGNIRRRIADAFAARGAEPPRDLWHAVLFYAAGEATRGALAAADRAGYVPYAIRLGLFERQPSWSAARDVLDAAWGRSLAGEGAVDAAWAALAQRLAPRAEPEADSADGDGGQ